MNGSNEKLTHLVTLKGFQIDFEFGPEGSLADS
jgi:hypothetical protein